MNIDNEILKKCLEIGQVHVSVYSDGLLCATLDMHSKELFRAYSDRGANHLFLLLASQSLGDCSLAQKADGLYPYPIGVLSVEKSDSVYRLVTDGCLSIYSTKDLVHIEQYVTKMQNLYSQPRPSYRSGVGVTFDEALKRIQDHDFEVTTCVPKNID